MKHKMENKRLELRRTEAADLPDSESRKINKQKTRTNKYLKYIVKVTEIKNSI